MLKRLSILLKPLCLFLLAYPAAFAPVAYGQNSYKGIWQGYINAKQNGVTWPNSGYTLHVEEQTADRISGTAYIYRKEVFVFEGILDFIGIIDQNTCKLTELKIVQSRIPNNFTFLCIKYLDLEFTDKDSIDYLTGNWNGALEDKTDCVPGKVFLRRFDPRNPDGIEPIPLPVMQAIHDDRSSEMKFLNTRLSKPVIINVSSPTVLLQLKDYLVEDNDTVSVYFNRKPLLKRLRIGKRPLRYTVWLDRNYGLHEILLYAENLGRIPPNTSLMTVIDGKLKHNLVIRSTDQESAVVYLRYKPQ